MANFCKSLTKFGKVGEGGVDLLIRDELLEQHQTRDRKAVGKACLATLEQWAEGQGVHGPWGGEQAWPPGGPRITGLKV